MSARIDLTSMDSTLKDVYALPGTRLKQWVVDMGREQKWRLETCPRFRMPVHDDNTGGSCRESGELAMWSHLANHDCCGECNDMAEAVASTPEVVAWSAARDARPPICQDHTLLSDEIQEDYAMTENPMLKMLRKL